MYYNADASTSMLMSQTPNLISEHNYWYHHPYADVGIQMSRDMRLQTM